MVVKRSDFMFVNLVILKLGKRRLWKMDLVVKSVLIFMN
jgi:hypothetical protein